jgi:hypothetical protein
MYFLSIVSTDSYPLSVPVLQKYAVDGWLLASGKPPEITEVEKWYIDDSDILFGGGGKVAAAAEAQKK